MTMCWTALTATAFWVSAVIAPGVAQVTRLEQPPEIPALQSYRDPVDEDLSRLLERRLAADPDDARTANQLTRKYLQTLRLSGNLAWLARAAGTAAQSLCAVSAEVNLEGLGLDALVRYESHDFVNAARLAQELCSAQPGDPRAFALLGDARLESGDYTGADSAYREMLRLDATQSGVTPAEDDVRVAHLAWLRGDTEAAHTGLNRALENAAKSTLRFSEMVAFCHVQIGQLDFGVGDWSAAETHYRAALTELPYQFSAYDHLAELAGARGNYPEAIRLYQELIAQVPRPEFFQDLADLYIFMGKPEEAKPWQDRAEAAYLASVARGEKLYCHHLTSFYADTRQSPAESLRWARKDLENCQSVFAREGLGWALYRTGDFAAAAVAFDQAVVLNTPSAHLFFQAGTVYFRAGQIARGREFIQRAQAVNPRFQSFHVHR